MLLSDDNSTISNGIGVYCASVYSLIIMFEILLLMILATKDKKAISDSTHCILEHKEFIISAMLVGFLLVISEFLTTTVFIIKNFGKYTAFHFLVWMSVPCSIILFLFTLFNYAFTRAYWEKIFKIKVKIKVVTFFTAIASNLHISTSRLSLCFANILIPIGISNQGYHSFSLHDHICLNLL